MRRTEFIKRRCITGLFLISSVLLLSQSEYPFFDGTDEETVDLMSEAKKQIEEIRKGEFILSIVDGQGKAISANAEIELTSHNFDFGTNLYGFEKLHDSNRSKQTSLDAIKEVFNTVIVCDYWKQNQKKSTSDPIWESPDYGFQVAEQMGKKTRFHALIYGIPHWIHKYQTEDEMWALIEQRIKLVAERYREKITEVDVINEFINNQYWKGPKQAYLNSTVFPNFAEPHNGARVIAISRKYFTNAKLVILESNLWNTNNPVYQEIYEYHKNLIQQGVDYDYIGYQAHYYAKGGVPFQEGTKEFGPRTFMMDEINKGMEQMGALGKPIVITEFSPPSRSNKVKNPDQPCLSDEEIAAWETNFYTLMFSKPYIAGVSRWFTIDNMGGRGMDAGIISEDGKLKPNFYSLKKLINNEWHTKLSTKFKKGTVSFRGFYGTYSLHVDGYEEISINLNSANTDQKISLLPNKQK